MLGDSVTERPEEKDKEMKDEKVRKAEIMTEEANAEEGEAEKPEEKRYEGGAPADRASYDSIVLIDAIARVAEVAGYRLSMSKAQLILWCLYGSCLASGNPLGIEQPQVWKYGPVFPSAYRKGRIHDRDVCEAAWKGLDEGAPEIAGLL